MWPAVSGSLLVDFRGVSTDDGGHEVPERNAAGVHEMLTRHDQADIGPDFNFRSDDPSRTRQLVLDLRQFDLPALHVHFDEYGVVDGRHHPVASFFQRDHRDA